MLVATATEYPLSGAGTPPTAAAPPPPSAACH